ncbi:hypothetical protein M426DRAFT_263820 [Hypoxylon sp. CI-4A]|nr:hypothetical protein M426DRAFT_263820 [Hypoxylon sp. CI-4A]
MGDQSKDVTSIPDKFKHTALSNDWKDPLRVATLSRSKDRDDIINCTIRHKKLAEVTGYRAISHTWSGGPQNLSKKEIRVDRKRFEVDDSVYRLLRRLREAENDVVLWIDVLCVRQDSDEETDEGKREAKDERSQQEMVLPPKIEFRYGSASFDEETLRGVRDGLVNQDDSDKEYRHKLTGEGFDPLMTFESIVVPMVSTREEWHKGTSLTLPGLRRRFPASEASWRQDLFYSLLGMVKDWGSQKPLKPDYALPSAQAIREAVYHCLLVEGNINFLHGLRGRSLLENYPTSWLADFHVQHSPTDIVWGEKRRFEIDHRFSVPQNRVLREGSIQLQPQGALTIKAVKIDEIEEIGDICNPLEHLEQVPAVVQKWTKKVFGDENVKWPDEMPQGDARKDAFWRTTINNCVPQTTTAPSSPSSPHSYTAPTDQDYKQLKALQGYLSLLSTAGGNSNGSNPTDQVPKTPTYRVIKDLESLVFKETPGLAYHFLFCPYKRRMITTKRGRLIGLAPQAVMAGDEVWIPHGSQVPYVFRPCGSDMVHLVCNAYVLGLMEGKEVEGETVQVSIV